MLQERLNDELTRADLICTTESKVECAPWRDRGFLERVALDMQQGISLIVRTGVALPSCGYDESAYAYEQNGSQWRKFWQSEQDDYREGKYSPQTLRAVRIVWTPKGGNEPVLLLSGSQMAYINAPIQGSVTPDGVLVRIRYKEGQAGARRSSCSCSAGFHRFLVTPSLAGEFPMDRGGKPLAVTTMAQAAPKRPDCQEKDVEADTIHSMFLTQ